MDTTFEVHPLLWRTWHRAWFQDLVIFPGPPLDQAWSGKPDDPERTRRLERYVTADTPELAALREILDAHFGVPIGHLCAGVRVGSRRDLTAPTLAIDMMGTFYGEGGGGVNTTTPALGEALCRLLLDELQVAWCDAWYVGCFHGFAVTVDRGPDGPVVKILQKGRRAEESAKEGAS